MTILRDGEKFACKQCIQGHRVSTCTHDERPLHHVARKGRPVSQCVHCRGLRKARAQHVKCDCGERRLSSHSRTNSSESATTGDEKGCQCYAGKKCTCALKKETTGFENNLAVPHHGLEPFFNHETGKPRIPNRRSESSVPRSRNIYQPALERSGGSSQDARSPYQMLSSPLARYHAAQRSVDSLPLFLNQTLSPTSQNTFPPTAFHHNTHLSAPGNTFYSIQSSSLPFESSQIPEVPSFGDFTVEPLAENVLERTLSPRNPNRHSISGAISGQWNMLLDSDLQHLGQNENTHQIYGNLRSHETQGFPFHAPSPQTWQNSWNNAGQQHRSPQAMAGIGELVVPGQVSHSRSSSGTVSEPVEPPSYHANHPLIQIDPSPTWTLSEDDKAWSGASYSDMVTDFQFSGDGMLPHYTDDFNIAEPSEFGDSQHNFTFPPTESRYESIDSSPDQTLPDRSIRQWHHTMSGSLPQFKFPPDSTYIEQYQDEQIQQYDWQNLAHDFIKEEDASSPYDN